MEPADRPVHDWYRFVLSYPPHLVRDYAAKFGLTPGATLLDPFCGTGTTIVEAKKLGLNSIGIEAHPLSHFASKTKINWSPKSTALLSAANAVADIYWDQIARDGVVDDGQTLLAEQSAKANLLQLPGSLSKLLLTASIGPLPLHKSLRLIAAIDAGAPPRLRDHLRLALAKALVGCIGNLHFGPEVGVGPPKDDAPVLRSWLGNVRKIAADLELVSRVKSGNACVHHADSRAMGTLLPRVPSMP